MSNASEIELPFSYPVNVRTLSKKGQNVKYSATEDVRKAIAKNYELISVESFEADCLLAPWKRDGIQLSGKIRAQITQPCAVTSEPLESVVNEIVEMVFVPEDSKLTKPRANDDGEWIFDVEGSEIPETFIGDSIDVAEVWLEFFTMGIDLFARIDGAVFDSVNNDDKDGIKPDSPFAALAAMKKH